MPNEDPHQEPGTGSVDPLVGKVLSDRYEIASLVARGGMGKIYKATQRPLGRSVALKVLDLHDDDREFRDRFFLEASLCARLTHPNTIRIYDYGTTADGIFYIAMEFLHGESLQKLLAREAPLDPQRALALVRQICGALAEAHDCGIVHRDLKPSNVFLTHHGETGEFAKVLDFGLVKELGKESELSRTGTVLGSPLYISPEQVHGEEIDGRADIYAVGLILYYMLTGKTAFRKGNTLSLLMQQTKARPPTFDESNPDVAIPSALEWTVMRCLEKRPEDRFHSMQELLKAIKACDRELRGDWTQPLELSLHAGTVLLPEGLEVSTEMRPPPEPPPAVGVDPIPEPTLATTTGNRTRSLGLMVLAGGGAISLGLILLLGLVVVGVGGLSMWGMSPSAPPPEPAPIAQPAPPPPVPAQPVLVKAEVRLDSTPSGAEVERDGVLVGTTPLTVSLLEGEEWVVTLKARGYQSRQVRLASDIPTQSVELRRTRRSTPVPPPQPPPEPIVEPAPVTEPSPVPPPRPGSDIRDPWAQGD